MLLGHDNTRTFTFLYLPDVLCAYIVAVLKPILPQLRDGRNSSKQSSLNSITCCYASLQIWTAQCPVMCCTQYIHGLFQRKKCVEIHVMVRNVSSWLTFTPHRQSLMCSSLIWLMMVKRLYLTMTCHVVFIEGCFAGQQQGRSLVILSFTWSGYSFRKHCGHGLSTLTFAYFFFLCFPPVTKVCISASVSLFYLHSVMVKESFAPIQHYTCSSAERIPVENVYGWCLVFFSTSEAVVEKRSSLNYIVSIWRHIYLIFGLSAWLPTFYFHIEIIYWLDRDRIH